MTIDQNQSDNAPMTDEDRLAARITANEADQLEWAQFETLASGSTGAWERLARSLRDELHMRSAMDRAFAAADAVEIPNEAFVDEPIAAIETLRARTGRWTGWAIAAMLAIAWVGTGVLTPLESGHVQTAGPGGGHDATTGGSGAQFAGYTNPDDAYRDYVRLGAEEGRVLQELPMVMIETRPVTDGSGRQVFEVFYVRQLLERTRVQDALQMNRDDRGRKVPVKVDLASFEPEQEL